MREFTRFEVAAINTKLIDIEGIPGAGKSMAARFIEDLLADSGENMSFYGENALNHPAEYPLHAFMKDEQIKALLPEEQRQLYSEGIKRLSGLVIPLIKVSVSLFSKIMPYKIYDNLDWESEKPVMLEHWQSFAKKALLRSKVYLFNSGILQNPINEMMMRFDFNYSVIWEYVFSIYRSIATLNPVFIYIKSTDIRARIEEETRKRNPGWLSSAIDYHTSQGFGKRNDMTGLEGYADCLEARQRIELKILNELPVEKLVLTDPFDDWDQAYNRMSGFLKMKSPV